MRSWMVALLVTALAVAGLGVILVLAFAGGGQTAVVDLEVGDCFDLPDQESGADVLVVETVDPIDCAEPHEAEVVLIGTLNPDGDRDYPSDAELFAEIDAICAFDVRVPGEFGLLPIAPNEATWDAFDGHFACVALPFGGGTVTGSVGRGG